MIEDGALIEVDDPDWVTLTGYIVVRDYKGKRFVNVFDIYNDVFLIEMNRKKSRIKAYSDLKYSILNEISITSDCEKYIEYILKISEENTAQNNNDALIKLNLLN